MSNAIANTLQVPAHIAARMTARQQGTGVSSSVLDSLLAGGKFPYPKVSIRAGRFRLIEDGTEHVYGLTLPVVIVGASPYTAKAFYGKPYDAKAVDARPDCFSNDGMVPDPSVQNPVSTSCSSCSHNVLGSKITPSGAKAKLCADSRNLAVVPSADPGKLYALSVPVSGMKNLRDYMTSIKNFGLKPEEVVTELSFDESTSYPKIIFKHAGYLSAEGCATVDTLLRDKADQIKEVTREKPLSGASTAMLTGVSPVASALLEAPAEGEEEAEPEGVVVASSAIDAKIDDLFGS